jgi:hypothetical protein
MPIWQTPDVLDQPDITIVRWRVLEITDGPCKGQRHLNGYCRENREGRASTTIVSFDQKKRICVTKSGRRYHLIGPSGFDGDGDYVWQIWSRSTPTFDVSKEFEMPAINREGFPQVLEIVVSSMIHGWPYDTFDPVIRYSPKFGWSVCSSEDVRSEESVDIDIKLLTELLYDDVNEGIIGPALACRLNDYWIQDKLLSCQNKNDRR